MFIPSNEYYTEMSPTDFERYSLSVLRKQFADKEGIEDFSIEHNVKMPAHDGIYQIDGLIKYKFLGMDFKVLVECKRYKNSVKREHVQALKGKLDSIGAQKGIFISTSSFQSGALEYAREHGIALATIIDGSLNYHTRSDDFNNGMHVYFGEPYQMAFQTMQPNGNINTSFLNHSDALFNFLINDRSGDRL